MTPLFHIKFVIRPRVSHLAEALNLYLLFPLIFFLLVDWPSGTKFGVLRSLIWLLRIVSVVVGISVLVVGALFSSTSSFKWFTASSFIHEGGASSILT